MRINNFIDFGVNRKRVYQKIKVSIFLTFILLLLVNLLFINNQVPSLKSNNTLNVGENHNDYNTELNSASGLSLYQNPFTKNFSLIWNFLFAGFYGGSGFLTIFIFISLEPILMIIGGYFLYQESSRI